ncbi:putative ribonuclease H protein [Vitis vinifera]|uniref:Putative ribonuclease H protein n=1 Tax=Vitis vinifera TaxID=29760 RepID=A0A438CQI4_VITVI|nr:putative ribonuclease H protein [Vitis vinifera]
MWFEALSGLRINLDKSEILPVGRVENLEALALEDGVEERFRRRFALWKRNYISKGGRIPLIRSTLSSMPIYLMSLLRMPRVVSLRLEKIQRDFLWGGGALERKPHLVNWESVCSDIRKGGLGVRRLSTLNRALLCKWNWRFANEREALWRQVISRKFGEEEGGWYTREVREGFGVGLWKEIRKEGALLQNKVVFSVGNGRRVKFWNDIWCGNFSLSNLFPSLYAFASFKEAWLVELWDHSGDEGVWNPSFSRSFNDWEVEGVERLLLTIRGRRLNPLLEDRMLWKETKDGIFSVKSLYSSLASRRDVQFPYSNIWSICVPTKVSFFAWEAYWGKVLTLDQLKKRGRSLANRCFLCGMEEESIDHILIQCSKARGLWSYCLLCLVLIGFSLLWLEILLEVGVALSWARSVGRCGTQPLCAFFGRFGRKETG